MLGRDPATAGATERAEARQALIAEKEAVSAESARTRQELASIRASRPDERREAELEARLQALMAEEHRLRLLIDRSARG